MIICVYADAKFTNEYFYGFPNTFLLILFVKFFKHDMIGNFNGTIYKVARIKQILYQVWCFYQKVNDFSLSRFTIYMYLKYNIDASRREIYTVVKFCLF